MYLRDFLIQDIRCFERVELEFPHVGEDYSGWIVLLGGNGMGKSTLLQAMAISLVGPLAGQRLLLNPDGWVRQGKEYGELAGSIVQGDDDVAWKLPSTRSPVVFVPAEKRKQPYEVRLAVTGREPVVLNATRYDQPQLVPLLVDERALLSGPYAAGNPGWFSCGYGPFRRLLGGTSEEFRLMSSIGREARYVTLFREGAALTHCLEWLSDLYIRSIDRNHPLRDRAGSALDAARRLIDSLLPGDVRVGGINSESVSFRNGSGAEVSVLDLSDGYRSFLSLTIDILRRLDDEPPGANRGTPRMHHGLSSWMEDEDGEPRITAGGIVLIDEVDAHLHPSWQREIGFRLRRVFPRMQFIVTTHSPFVAQAASDGGLFVLRATAPGKAVEVEQPLDSVKGWRVDQILTSPLFGLDATRDEETEALIRKHAELVARRTWGKLTRAEGQQLARLTEMLDDRLTAPGETAEERELQAKTAAFIRTALERRKAKK